MLRMPPQGDIALRDLINTLSFQGALESRIYFEKYSSTTCYIYIKIGSKWLRYILLKDVDGVKNVDVWRINGLSVVTFAADTPITKGSLLTNVYLTGGSQWEYAIKPFGAADFMGGFHGDEIVQTSSFTVDGTAIDIASLADGTKFTCQEFVVEQTTKLYDPDDGVTNLADVDPVNHIFTSAGLQIITSINWLTTKDIGVSYAGMFPLLRGSALTAYCQYYDLDTVYDISEAGHSQPGKNTNGIRLWNTSNNLEFELSFDNLDWFNDYVLSATKAIFVVNDAAYNKVYGTRILNSTDKETVNNGDIWKASTRYKVIYPD